MVTREELRRKRERAELTQVELAKLVGVTRQTIWNWENGTRKMGRVEEIALEKVFEDLRE